MTQDTHKVSIFFWNSNVHLRRFGCNDLSVEALFAEVDLTAVRLVDGHCGALMEYLGWIGRGSEAAS